MTGTDAAVAVGAARTRGITVDLDGDDPDFMWAAAASLPLWVRDRDVIGFAYPVNVTDEAGMRHREVAAQSAFVAAVGVDGDAADMVLGWR